MAGVKQHSRCWTSIQRILKIQMWEFGGQTKRQVQGFKMSESISKGNVFDSVLIPDDPMMGQLAKHTKILRRIIKQAQQIITDLQNVPLKYAVKCKKKKKR